MKDSVATGLVLKTSDFSIEDEMETFLAGRGGGVVRMSSLFR